MVDAPADTAGNAGKNPQREERGAFAFAGFVFDLEACTLKRESGEAVALTRGEFALLREFVRRPGRALSRDLLLDAMAGRRNTPFDRSVDVMVGRLRRKIEPDPKQPSVIQTVPGEGYRFNVPLAPRKPGAETGAATTADAPGDMTVPFPAASRRTWRALWPVPAAAVALCLFAAAAAIQWRPIPQDAAPRLSIVVLPFENMSGDKEQDYFADGITDDLTTDLSHLSDFVISRGTAFTYKGKPISPKEIGRELGVRYVLEGSVRRLAEKIEVNAQLISTETGAHVWADRFDGERSRLGELQVEIVARLGRSLDVELVRAEALRGARERPSNPDAADLAIQADAKSSFPPSKANLNDVVTLSERALALDPQNVRALTVLAGASLDRVSDQWSEDPSGDIARAEKATDAALALRPENSLVHYVRGYLYQVKQQWGPSIAEEETAIALDPNNARAHGLGGLDKMFVGRSEDGLAGVETALRLSPRDPHVPWWQFDMCALQGNLGHDEQAIPWCNKAAAGLPQVYLPLLHLAAANALAGHDTEAKEAAAQLLKVYPGFTVQGWASIHWSDDPTFNARYQRVTDGLRKAGLPEGEKQAN